jgi:hypothetical protein
MRQLIVGPLHSRLLQQIQELPDIRAAVNAGSATFAHYAAAIIATTDPSAVLQSHHEASRPKRRSGERLVDAVLRAKLAFRTAAAHGCQPAAAGRFWAVFGLLTPAEQSSYTGRPGVLTYDMPYVAYNMLAWGGGGQRDVLAMPLQLPWVLLPGRVPERGCLRRGVEMARLRQTAARLDCHRKVKIRVTEKRQQASPRPSLKSRAGLVSRCRCSPAAARAPSDPRLHRIPALRYSTRPSRDGCIAVHPTLPSPPRPPPRAP